MRVLLTGNQGYIGPVVSEGLVAAGHTVIGLDSGLFEDCWLEPCVDAPTATCDIRDVRLDDLRGFDAVVHLANLSNDPLGTLDSALTYKSTSTPRCGWRGWRVRRACAAS